MKALLIALLSLPPLARAENVCRTAAELTELTNFCEDNFYYVKAADECAAWLKEKVNAETAAVQKRYVQNDGKNQTLDYNNSLKDYRFTSESLARLIALHQQAIADITPYFDIVVMPEDWEVPQATGGDLDGFLNSYPCYANTRESIRHVIQVLNDRIANLQNAKKVADAHNQTANQRDTHNDVLVPATVLKNGVGQGSGKRVPAGKSENSQSDITGTAENAQKKAKGETVLQNQNNENGNKLP